MIVIDTNIIAYLFLKDERSPLAERALLRDPIWTAPLLWRNEFRNVLALYIRKKHLTVTKAVKIMKEADEILSEREFSVSSYSVFELVTQSRCSAYDCEFVALAQDLGVSLLTNDKLVLAEFPKTAISLEDFLNRRNRD